MRTKPEEIASAASNRGNASSSLRTARWLPRRGQEAERRHHERPPKATEENARPRRRYSVAV